MFMFFFIGEAKYNLGAGYVSTDINCHELCRLAYFL